MLFSFFFFFVSSLNYFQVVLHISTFSFNQVQTLCINKIKSSLQRVDYCRLPDTEKCLSPLLLLNNSHFINKEIFLSLFFFPFSSQRLGARSLDTAAEQVWIPIYSRCTINEYKRCTVLPMFSACLSVTQISCSLGHVSHCNTCI